MRVHWNTNVNQSENSGFMSRNVGMLPKGNRLRAKVADGPSQKCSRQINCTARAYGEKIRSLRFAVIALGLNVIAKD